MKTFLLVTIYASAILVVASILLQSKGTGLGAVFGASTNIYKVKRGAEKLLFYLTIIASLFFFGAVFALIFVK
ncbi:TPA: preprotein translocase subunit SecG [candidate division CPR2 bacterium]|uniref:Protein-export membrane protein SecG n=1 Tax=candidate division CPR2 bacterium GW2011_GWC1_41_48 TaxID=1618344 RepID=A0A0G0Z7H3_UNCC2|nr:MAG: Preprotein translocase, SecG subunit [candidate division CPR2 bacterium GW2011_GWC2_39_35]KKR28832.1 MAG: Preprotein translocase, SecG subunit [candidate division CPR2 bacterium GW2011_GWD1_39_7]KKR29343.1 MAG: Preprotein translocase, SecG subunit [candidate division CPR2 bacterium GW2011_GWD2_39_7]KKS08998.1 MAG: Preprotein translocase, SecG subunit [candidate division CPR2 bacterium GW2011_GWC1_41_48]OGB61441.1 MAG: preprotein translocase subunit SecG [candidate division CPR2 bacteriu